jgi:hypothetical protein
MYDIYRMTIYYFLKMTKKPVKTGRFEKFGQTGPVTGKPVSAGWPAFASLVPSMSIIKSSYYDTCSVAKAEFAIISIFHIRLPVF